MSYQVLARKWRPQNFKQMVGQEHVLKALIHALESQRLHHAYLFTGTRGVGKTTIGRILAKCLSCHEGITAEPCGVCGACKGIAEGRYVDLIEIDAASRTKVEDMRELLDNVQYAASEGRFKIYLIDEVHMLSQSSFNALLKTLEEPPEHVKFLFATTDPQKLPVTILSRCLQFNLKNMPPERIVSHLKNILAQESVQSEDAALWALARAADGSMRDALSLTDQAIAYGNHSLTEAGVSAMLGTVDQKKIYRILDALIKGNAADVLSEVKGLAEFSPDYSSVLATLISILHRVAVEQAVPGSADNSMGDQDQVSTYARQLCAEDVQLFYQIALVSRKDLQIAPDPRAGFEMALLRMMAFQLQPAANDALPILESSQEQPDAPNTNDTETEPALDIAPAPRIEAYDENLAQELSSDEALENEAFGQHTEAQNHEESGRHENVSVIEGSSESKKKTLNDQGDKVEDRESSQELPRQVTGAEQSGDRDYLDSINRDGITGHDPRASNDDSTGHDASTNHDLSKSHDANMSQDSHIESVGDLERDGNLAVTSRVGDESANMPDSKTEDGDAWSKIAAAIEVSGMTQNLLLNMALVQANDTLTLYVESGHFRLLNPTHKERISLAMHQYFGDQYRIEFVDGLLNGQETPMMWRDRRKAEMLAQAKQNLKTDPNVQQLIELFDGVLVEESIEAVGKLH